MAAFLFVYSRRLRTLSALPVLENKKARRCWRAFRVDVAWVYFLFSFFQAAICVSCS